MSSFHDDGESEDVLAFLEARDLSLSSSIVQSAEHTADDAAFKSSKLQDLSSASHLCDGGDSADARPTSDSSEKGTFQRLLV